MMFAEGKEGLKRKNGKGVVIGYDLNHAYVQISYCMASADEPETFAAVTGTQQYHIPAVLCKRNEVNQWFYGNEAIRHAQDGDGIRVDNLLVLAWEGEPVDVGGTAFDPIALLTLFIRRSLSAVGMEIPEAPLEGLMFTVENPDERMREVLLKVAANLHLKIEHIYFQNYLESFYYYMLNQEERIWIDAVLLCDYDGKRMKLYELSSNRRTTPVVVFIDSLEYSSMESVYEDRSKEEKARLDQCFLDILKERCIKKKFSAAYLIGDGYKDEWAQDSIRFLCQGRRVFQGNNLYGKGACFGIREKLGCTQKEEGHVFLGDYKLRTNIGMKVLRRGADSYFTILDAGLNWYDAKKEFEIILESGDSVSILLTPLTGKDAREINMILSGLPNRPDRTTRLQLLAEMVSEKEVSIHVKDKGFGELFPSSGGEWRKLFEV